MNELSLFDSLFNNSFDNAFNCLGYRTTSVPKVDVKSTDKEYDLEMELPGRTEDEVNIELDGNTLSISSKTVESKNEEKDTKKEAKDNTKWLIKERYSSSFRRTFTIPDDVDSENVKASFKNGILFINMPRKELPQPKKIAIECA